MRYFILFSFLFSNLAYGQSLTGQVRDSENQILPGVVVFWKGKINKAALTDEKGEFIISKTPTDHLLFFRHQSYLTDSVEVQSETPVTFSLKNANTDLEAVVVKGKATFIDKLSPIPTEVLTSRTLAKAACCNLSESFETNASVSVSYSDAITGSKQIQLLGLSGLYTQTNFENIPIIRGLAVPFGLNSIPGTWIQSIDIAKGVGSVLNGYENMAGGLNVELKKPDQSERLLLNAYVNNFGRGEVNLNLTTKKEKGWSNTILSHGSFLQSNIDYNNDSFLDLPKYGQINVLNRWKYVDSRKMIQFGGRILYENRVGGQKGFQDLKATPNLYGFTNKTFRPEFFLKMAKLYQSQPYKGLGFIAHASQYKSDTYFGFKPYLALENSIYANLIYQNILGTTEHTYKTGLSFLADNFDELYGGLSRKRQEIVPGAYFEYTYNKNNKTVLVAGLRNDFHNLYGNQFSPRVHVKQDINSNNTIRLSAGKGFRVPNPFADNYGYLVSGRSVKFLGDINPEVSWTYGGSYHYDKSKFNLMAEYFLTSFQNQLIADTEHSGYLYFYDLNGKAITKSAMLELNYEASKSFEFKLAYRYTDSRQTLGKPFGEQVYLPKMFVAKDRILFNAAYALPYDKWKIDFTWQWNGRRRIMDFKQSNEAIHGSYNAINSVNAPDFSTINAQVSRKFTYFEWYLGGENLTGFRQKNPILGANDPFGSKFDAGMVWGPVTGATVYSGFRYKLQ
jgi:outer membrane receptor for ferrienterochelin and colicins